MSAHPHPSAGSVLVEALGDDVGRLHPRVRRYVDGPGEGIGVCEGVFDVAGSRFRGLLLLARPFVGPGLLVTRYGRSIPFRVVNRPDAVRGELHAERIFRFPRGAQHFVDILRTGSVPGTLQNVLGKAGRVELRLRCGVSEEGHLRLHSERAWFRVGRWSLPLPGILGVRVEVEDGYDEEAGRQTVRVRARNPLLGTVLEYCGSFTYRTEGASGR